MNEVTVFGMLLVAANGMAGDWIRRTPARPARFERRMHA